MSVLTLAEQATPDVPSAGKRKVYLKADGFLYTRDSAGVERPLAGASSYLDLTPQTTPTYQRGRIWYDSTTESLSVQDDLSGTSIQVGQETILRVRNNSGATILNGKTVYISGATGQNPTIALARADADTTSKIIGVATHDIPNNTIGKVTVYGLVNDLDTSAFADGTEVFLSATTAGALTSVAPSGPVNALVKVGIIAYSHASNGKLLVNPDRLSAFDITKTLGSAIIAATDTQVLNGNFQINQDSVAGTVVLAAGIYGHDGWKAGAGGCTYTFSTSDGITTINISAGSLVQVIPGVDLLSEVYSLHWGGTSQGKIGAGAYSPTGISGSAVAGTNLSLEFNVGTLSLVRFIRGLLELPYRHITPKEMLQKCMGFYQLPGVGMIEGQFYSTTAVRLTWQFIVPMQGVPVVTVISTTADAIGSGSTTFTASSGITPSEQSVYFDLTGATVARVQYQQAVFNGSIKASSRL